MSANQDDAVRPQSITTQNTFPPTTGRSPSGRHSPDRNCLVVLSTDSSSGMTNPVTSVFAVNTEQHDAVTANPSPRHSRWGDWVFGSMKMNKLVRPHDLFFAEFNRDIVFTSHHFADRAMLAEDADDYNTTWLRSSHSDYADYFSFLWRQTKNECTAPFHESADVDSPLPEFKKLRKLTGKTRPIQRIDLHAELLD